MRVLYIDIDACNPEHLGCYGYPRNTSPAIDSLAREGVLFRNCYCSDAPCLPSRTAMYSGRFGIQTGVVGHGGSTADPRPNGSGRGFQDEFTSSSLPAVLAENGFHTVLVSPFAERHSAHWFTAGFREIHNTGQCGMESVDDVEPELMSWLDRRGCDDNWYVHVNFWDPHTPYRVPDSYGDPFADDPLPPWVDDSAQLSQHMRLPGPHTALDPGMYGDEDAGRWPRTVSRIDSMEALCHWVNGYDTAIRYVDDAIGRIVTKLKELGIYEETAIVVSADHGECQGHLGIYGEHGTADEGTCHIPMVVKWPGGASGREDEGLHYHLDFAPTLTELLGIGRRDLWDGESYAEAVRPAAGDASSGRDELILSQCAHVCQRAVRWERWLYIRTWHDGFHNFPHEMLYDLVEDPREQNNLAESMPETCREGSRRLSLWESRQLYARSMRCAAGLPGTGTDDPLWRVIEEGGPFHARLTSPGTPGSPEAFEAYCERLEATGREQAAEVLREKYSEYLRANRQQIR